MFRADALKYTNLYPKTLQITQLLLQHPNEIIVIQQISFKLNLCKSFS